MSPPEPPPLEADRALVQGVLARAPGAFERLVRTYQGLCWRIINRMVRHADDTQELCQETFLRVHQRLHQYRFESALKSWIGQVAYSIALRHLERKRVALVVSVDGDGEIDLMDRVCDDFDLEAASADAELAASLHAAIETLPPVARTVLTLYHLDELPIGEIATITGLPDGTIKSHLFRSRALLRRKLERRLGLAV